MAFNVKFFRFAKNTSSTMRPKDEGQTYACVLLEATEIISPRIALNVAGNPTRYNYAYIEEFDRYYFVNDWEWNKGRWSASLNVDALASWKPEIGELTEYVLRSTRECDPHITDTTYPTKNPCITVPIKIKNPLWDGSLSSGKYVVGIINNDSNGIGAVSYYAFSQEQFRIFCNKLMDNTDWLSVPQEELSQELLKALYNPFQYVVSCMWFPIYPPVGPTLTDLPYGWWRLSGVSCNRIDVEATSSIGYELSKQGEIPLHPQYKTATKYLNYAPYTEYILDFPLFGQIQLDPSKMYQFQEGDNPNNIPPRLYFHIDVDFITGKATLMVGNVYYGQGNNPSAFAYRNAQIGVPIQLAQMAVDNLGVVDSAIQTVANTASSVISKDVPGAIASASSGIVSTIKASIPQMMTSGCNGSLLGLKKPIYLQCFFYPIVEEDLTHRGRPLCQNRKISTLPGFIMTSDADVDIPATQAEIDEIKSKMNRGFYYE